MIAMLTIEGHLNVESTTSIGQGSEYQRFAVHREV